MNWPLPEDGPRVAGDIEKRTRYESVGRVTNTGHLVPACGCGWFGTVHGVPVEVKKGGVKQYGREVAETACREQHALHLTDVARGNV